MSFLSFHERLILKFIIFDFFFRLPGELTIADIRWFSVYDTVNQRDLGHVIIPEGINVPPSLSEIIPVDTDFPNCQMLHSNLAVAWSVFAPSITIQLIGNVDENDYIGFGFSKPGASKMVGSDVAIAYVDGLLVKKVFVFFHVNIIFVCFVL